MTEVGEITKLEKLREAYITAKLKWLHEVRDVQSVCNHEKIVEAEAGEGVYIRMCLTCCMSENSRHSWTLLQWKVPQDVPVLSPPRVAKSWIFQRRAGLLFDGDQGQVSNDIAGAILSGKLTQGAMVSTYFEDYKLLERSSH